MNRFGIHAGAGTSSDCITRGSSFSSDNVDKIEIFKFCLFHSVLVTPLIRRFSNKLTASLGLLYRCFRMVHYKLTYFNGRGPAEIIRQVS